ncbi:MAG TPA: glycoside hydrolase family 38 C-terminal domain-containing protein [Phycisphaerae bacterium]|nr:glycoside hydrolase family 38 C-terminal domain-containing protein [Phycisphaerae bacterium]
MKTVHMIGNAHLDPVWLWSKADGIDSSIATARSACDRLDEYPEFIFTCSASWFHRQVEQIDPSLFARIRAFVAAGRWQLVGGMVIQPDCNLPSARSFARQLEFGQKYFADTFGRKATVGYNVDSFGHTAYLPRFLRDAGMDSYVFMRPMHYERELPANLFRWRSPDGHEVTAFRISGAYCTPAEDLREHIEVALAATADGIEHTMCFFGVGDHGGGPTKEQIEWIRANADAVDGARLVFSHPRAFFNEVADCRADLPIWTGELQHHAIGCYSVNRRIKVATRRAEEALCRAESTVDALGEHVTDEDWADIRRAWDRVLFNQFHDIAGGTSLDAASRIASGELVAAESLAQDVVTRVTRRASRASVVVGEHRVAIFNPSDRAFDGLVMHEPWLQWRGWPVRLVDQDGRDIEFQSVWPDMAVNGITRLLLPITVPPRGWRFVRLTELPPAEPCKSDHPTPASELLDRQDGRGGPAGPVCGPAKVTVDGDAICAGDLAVTLEVDSDETDTWSHTSINSFKGTNVGRVNWCEPMQVIEAGKLRSSALLRGRFGTSRVTCRLETPADGSVVRLRLSVVWSQRRQLLRLCIRGFDALTTRTDLVSGGPLDRAIDGLEYPLAGGLMVSSGRSRLAIISPDVLSVSVKADEINLTLLRSPVVAHHDPALPADYPYDTVTDQGCHEFDIILQPDFVQDAAALQRMVEASQVQPVVWDLTG